jgi:hypothetical protein
VACGGQPAAAVSGPVSGTATATVTATATAAASVTTTPGGFAMKAPAVTAYGDALGAIGLEAGHLPPLNKLTPEQLRKVMPLFAKSLGIKCEGCHDFDHPRELTHRQKTAELMWSRFVMKLEVQGDAGGAVFCDSCHHGSVQVLDRGDKHALARWMDESFVHGLGAKDCGQCHGTPFRPRFL